VVVVADTLRADFVGRGSRARLTPALDAFAAESVGFSAAFAAAPWTKPSVASLLTGLHPPMHGVVNHDGLYFRGEDGVANRAGVLPGDVDTLPETLSDAGYQTAAFVANRWLTPGYGYEQGFDEYAFVERGQVGNVFARALRWLAERDPSRPFLLYLHLMEPHGPYTAPEPFVQQARAALAHEPRRPLSPDARDSIPEVLAGQPWADAERARELREWRARYGAGVAAFDAAFGRFVEIAGASGWLDASVVVVTSDHGEELLDHGGWEHGSTFFEEMLRVPLLVRLPGGRHGGRRVEAVTSLVDLPPTLLGLAGLEPPATGPAALRGRSRVPALCDAAPPPPGGRAIASAAKNDSGTWALRTPRHKLILDIRSGSARLFDLESDPGEQRDVSRLQPERARALERELRAHVEALGAYQRTVVSAPVDPEMRARMEALGYVEAESGSE